MTHPPTKRYTEDEDNLIISLWSQSPPPPFATLTEALPTRSAVSIRKRIRHLHRVGKLEPHTTPKAKKEWYKTLPDEPVLAPGTANLLWVNGGRNQGGANEEYERLKKQNFTCALTGASFTQRLQPKLVKLGSQQIYVLPPVANIVLSNPPEVSRRVLAAITRFKPPLLLE